MLFVLSFEIRLDKMCKVIFHHLVLQVVKIINFGFTIHIDHIRDVFALYNALDTAIGVAKVIAESLLHYLTRQSWIEVWSWLLFRNVEVFNQEFLKHHICSCVKRIKPQHTKSSGSGDKPTFDSESLLCHLLTALI